MLLADDLKDATGTPANGVTYSNGVPTFVLRLMCILTIELFHLHMQTKELMMVI